MPSPFKRTAIATQTMLLAVGVAGATCAQDPLPSCNERRETGAFLLQFVRDTTIESSSKFVPSEDRIATFDQDGTLWVEHPMYAQVVFCLELARRRRREAIVQGCRAVQDGVKFKRRIPTLKPVGPTGV